MIAKYFEIVEKAIQEKDLDSRVSIISTILLTTSIYLSNFHVVVSILILIFITAFSKNAIFGILASIPFLILFSISITFFGGNLLVVLAIAALISIGSGILYGTNIEELRKALIYFKVPKKVAFILSLAFRMFYIYIKDLRNISEILALNEVSRISYYKKMMKTFVSIAILRSIAIAEAIYSKDLKFDANFDMKFKMKRKDTILLIFSLSTLAISIFFGFNAKA